MSRILPAALIAAAGLAAMIAWEAQGPAQPDFGETLRHAPGPEIAHNAPAVDPLVVAQSWMATAQERPLFRTDRRPATATNEAAPKADGPTRLTGVITGPFGNRAIFMSTASAKPVVVKEGARVADFVVRSVEPGRVVVVGAGGSERTLKPSFADGRLPPPR